MHRALEDRAEHLGTGVAVLRKVRRPVGGLRDGATLDDGECSGRYLAHTAKEGAVVVVEESEAKVLVHLLIVDLAREGLVLQDRLDLRSEHDAAAMTSVEQRLDPEVIARQHEPWRRFALVEDRERPHPVEAAEAIRPPFRVGVEHHLGVAGRVKRVAACFQLCAQFAKVVDLAVVDHLQPAGFHGHRLVAVLEVDDAEPAKPERCDAILEMAVIIRAAMSQRDGHRRQQGAVRRPPETRYPAHVTSSLASHRDGP